MMERVFRSAGFKPEETLIYHNTLDLFPFYASYKSAGYRQVARSGGNDIFFMDRTSGAFIDAVNQLDFLIVNSVFSLRRSAELGIEEKRLRVIKGGCEAAPDQTPALELADDRPVILNCGRLVDFKGLEDALHALAEVKRQGLSFLFVIVGEGELEKDLRNLAGELGLADDVCFYGKVSPLMVQGFYKHSALYLSTSKDVMRESKGRRYLHTETMGRSICEAQANGVPLVATDAGGVPEMLQDGTTGLLVPQGDVGAIAGAVGQLLADEPLRRRMGDKAREFAETEFGWDRVVSQSIDLVASIKLDEK
ncbi:glycosyltransferase [Pseudomaricurvus sp. HS19]|nr:glycosyltransferase [Pseudomaricurvus sp. HS19]